MNYLIFFIIYPILLNAQGLDSPQLAEELCILYYVLFNLIGAKFEYMIEKRQRVSHLEAIKSFRKISHYEKQYSMIQMMAEKVFSSIQENRAAIEASGFIPGVSEFPSDDKAREALSSILENTALFSEIIIRYPDIAVIVLKTNNNWDILLQWGIAFSNQMRYLLDNSTIKLLHLVSQELNHIDQDPNYINPYRKKKHTEQEDTSSTEKSRKKKKKLKKGPRMVIHNEL